MAQRSMTLQELNARGIYLSERCEGAGADRTVHSRMLAAMRESGLSAADAYRKVLSEDRDLRERRERARNAPKWLRSAGIEEAL